MSALASPATSTEEEPVEQPKSKAARQDMPVVTKFIDDLRQVFGKEEVDDWIRKGMRNGTFWAVENGKAIGNVPDESLFEHGLIDEEELNYRQSQGFY